MNLFFELAFCIISQYLTVWNWGVIGKYLTSLLNCKFMSIGKQVSFTKVLMAIYRGSYSSKHTRLLYEKPRNHYNGIRNFWLCWLFNSQLFQNMNFEALILLFLLFTFCDSVNLKKLKKKILYYPVEHPWLVHVNVWQKSLQYCKIISL